MHTINQQHKEQVKLAKKEELMTKIIISKKIGENLVVDFELTEGQ